jgi:hypothetical protein
MIKFKNIEIVGCHRDLHYEWSIAVHSNTYGNIVLEEEIDWKTKKESLKPERP